MPIFIGIAFCLSFLASSVFAQTKVPEAETIPKPGSKASKQTDSSTIAQKKAMVNALLKQAGEDEDKGRLDQARVGLYAAKTMLGDEGEPELQARLHYHLGVVENRLDHREESRQAYALARTFYQKDRSPGGESYAVRGLGEIEAIAGRIESARDLYKEAVRLSKLDRDRRGYANALYCLADLEREQSNYEEAEKYFSMSLVAARDVKFTLGEANAQSGLGDVYLAKKNHEDAFTTYQAAYVLYEAQRIRLSEANMKLGLGRVMLLQKKLEAARKYFEDASQLYTIEQYLAGQADALVDMGDLERAQTGRSTQAQEAYSQALGMYSEDSFIGRGNAFIGLAHTYRVAKRFVDAEKNYASALSAYQVRQNVSGQAQVQLGLGDLRVAQNRPDQATVYFNAALTLYKSIKDPLGQDECNARLARLSKTP
jgi:tetratricopeptide (TPR) repeat protein